MLKGYTTPLSPRGKSSVVPAPPWHNAGVTFAIEYWADPDRANAYLPEGFEPSENAGHAYAHFVEWQSSKAEQEELLDPVRAQYNEFFVIIAAKYRGEEIYVCPYMYVDTDTNMYRGLIQGLPKQVASIYMTRSYPLANAASGGLVEGARLGASFAYRDNRLADARLTLRAPSDDAIGLASTPIYGVRHFPDLAGGPDAKPLVHDIVAFAGYDKHVAEVWSADAELEIRSAPNQEIGDLAPVKIGRAARYAIGFSISHIEKIRDL